MSSWHEPLDRDGFTILRRVYSPDLVQRVLRELAGGLDQTPDAESRIASDDGTVRVDLCEICAPPSELLALARGRLVGA